MDIELKQANELETLHRNASLETLYGLSGCWQKASTTTNEEKLIEYDSDFLDRIHILTVFLVSLCGSSIVILILICACLSSDTVSMLLRRKPPEKGIEGQFPFLLESNFLDDEEYDATPVQDTLRIPVVIEPDYTSPVLDTGGLLSGNTPCSNKRERTDTLATSFCEGSMISIVIDDLSDQPYNNTTGSMDIHTSTHSINLS